MVMRKNEATAQAQAAFTFLRAQASFRREAICLPVTQGWLWAPTPTHPQTLMSFLASTSPFQAVLPPL